MQNELNNDLEAAAYQFGRRDGRYGLERFPHLPVQYQASYDAGYDAGQAQS